MICTGTRSGSEAEIHAAYEAVADRVVVGARVLGQVKPSLFPSQAG